LKKLLLQKNIHAPGTVAWEKVELIQGGEGAMLMHEREQEGLVHERVLGIGAPATCVVHASRAETRLDRLGANESLKYEFCP